MGNKTSFENVMISSVTQEANQYTGIVDRPSLRYIYRLVSTRTGKDNPKYKQKIAAKENATNQLDAVKNQIIDIPGKKVEVILKGQFKGLTAIDTQLGIQPVVDSSDFPEALLVEARNSASLGIRKKIANQMKSFSGPTFLGELKESLHQIRHPAESAFNLLHTWAKKTDRTLRKKLPKKGKKNLTKSETTAVKALAGSWLEVSFGLLPLVSDITDICTSALDVMEEDRVKRVSYFKVEEKCTSSQSVVYPNYSNCGLIYNQHVIEEVMVRYTVGFDRQVEASNNAMTNVINAGGFNFSEIVPTCWELLPWSFFIDYFSNIGDVLSANYMSMSNVRWSYETDRLIRTHEILGQANGYKMLDTSNTYGVKEYQPRFTYGIHSRVKRVATSIPFSEMRFELPSGNVKFLNMAALAALVLSK